MYILHLLVNCLNITETISWDWITRETLHLYDKAVFFQVRRLRNESFRMLNGSYVEKWCWLQCKYGDWDGGLHVASILSCNINIIIIIFFSISLGSWKTMGWRSIYTDRRSHEEYIDGSCAGKNVGSCTSGKCNVELVLINFIWCLNYHSICLWYRKSHTTLSIDWWIGRSCVMDLWESNNISSLPRWVKERF